MPGPPVLACSDTAHSQWPNCSRVLRLLLHSMLPAELPDPAAECGRCDNLKIRFQQKDLDTDEWETVDASGQVHPLAGYAHCPAG